MFLHRLRWYAAGFLCILASTAFATNPAELYELPVPAVCITSLGPMALLVKARDQGISADQALASLRRIRPDVEISKELVANVYDHPALSMNALERYTLWSCHARAHMIQPLPLNEVAADMRDCYASSSAPECALRFQNRITGLPPEYRPRSTLVRPAARR